MKTEEEIPAIQDDTQAEDNTQELNAWQAVGIYTQFAIEETIAKRMKANEQLVYISLIRASFGYREVQCTMQISRLMEMTRLSKPTAIKMLHKLQENNYIARIQSNKEMGPKKAYIYRIVFQASLPFITFKERTNKSEPVSKDTEAKFNALSEEAQNNIISDIKRENKRIHGTGLQKVALQWWFDQDKKEGRDIYLYHTDIEEYVRLHPENKDKLIKDRLIDEDGKKYVPGASLADCL